MAGLVIRILLVWFVALGMASAAPVRADASQALAETLENNDTGGIPVVVFNRKITEIRAGLEGYPPELRARSISDRVTTMLTEDPQAAISHDKTDIGIAIRIGKTIAFYLRPGDINPDSDETLETRAEQAIHELHKVQKDRELLYNSGALIRAIVVVLGATAALVIALRVLVYVRRWLMIRIRRRIVRPLLKRATKFTGHHAPFLARVMRSSTNFIVVLLGLFAFYSWLSLVLHEIPYTRAWSENLNISLLVFLERGMVNALDMIPSLLVAALIVLLARYVTHFIHYIFGRIERGELQLPMFDRDTASTTRRLMVFAVWLFAIAMIYPYLPGADTEAFKGLSVMVGLMVSLGASSIVGQFASGLIIIYSRALKVGEYVQIGEVEGTVVQIGLFATKIHTNLREEISIPNSGLVGQNVKNYSRLASGGGVVTTVGVTIGYDTPWRQVEAMLLEAAVRTQGIRTDPHPVVFQTGLSDWYVEYQLRVAVDEPRRKFEIINELNGKIQDTFNHYGVQIMSPHYIADPDKEKIVPETMRAPAPARAENRP